MPQTAADPPIISTDSSARRASSQPLLVWRVHLLRREPYRLPALLALLGLAFVCVWAMFGTLLPALVAVALLIGATGEFLFPISYRLTEEGIYAEGPASRLALRWQEVRRCLPDVRGLTLTPLAKPSRLDAFRGVTLRFAPDGEPGDKASVLAILAERAPELMLPSPTNAERKP